MTPLGWNWYSVNRGSEPEFRLLGGFFAKLYQEESTNCRLSDIVEENKFGWRRLSHEKNNCPDLRVGQ